MSTLAATVVVVGAFTAVDTAHGQSLLGHGRRTTFFGVAHRVTAPSVRLADGRVVTNSATLTFRDVPVGGSSKPKSLFLSSGSHELRGLRIKASPPAFHLVNGCHHHLAARSRCSVGIAFQPNHPGHVPGRLSISFVEDPKLKIVLAGTAVKAVGPTVNPQPLTFPRTEVGSTAPAETVTLRAGSAPLPIAKITTGSSKEFKVVQKSCRNSLPAQSECKIRVVFTPAGAGPRNANLTVARSDRGAPLTAALHGIGVGQPTKPTKPTLTLNGANFGSIAIGTHSRISFTLGAGSSAVQIADIRATASGTGANANEYSATNDCGAKVKAGHHCTIRVTFAPLASGKQPGEVVVRRSDGGAHLSAALHGTGVRLPTKPTLTQAGEFGEVWVDFGGPSTPTPTTSSKTFTLSAGSSRFPYGGATLTGRDSTDFQIVDETCSGAVPASHTCKISVTFSPGSYGSKSAILTVRGTGASKLTAKLTGVGLAPDIAVSPKSPSGPFNFGTVCIHCGTPWSTQMFTVSNSGNARLTIGSITSTEPNVFTVDTGAGTCVEKPVGPDQTCTFSVTFTPNSSGPAKPAKIRLYPNQVDQSSFYVTGTGGK
jgi:hypothetical protein